MRLKNIIQDIFSAVKKINKSGKIKSSYVYGNGDSGKVSDILEKWNLSLKNHYLLIMRILS